MVFGQHTQGFLIWFGQPYTKNPQSCHRAVCSCGLTLGRIVTHNMENCKRGTKRGKVKTSLTRATSIETVTTSAVSCDRTKQHPEEMNQPGHFSWSAGSVRLVDPLLGYSRPSLTFPAPGAPLSHTTSRGTCTCSSLNCSSNRRQLASKLTMLSIDILPSTGSSRGRLVAGRSNRN